MIIILSKRYSDISNKELGQRLNLSEPTVSNILSEQSNHEKLK
ncbi:winged helix-turn-helix transcriptional regulator [Caloranaerobacter sp. DY30410]